MREEVKRLKVKFTMHSSFASSFFLPQPLRCFGNCYPKVVGNPKSAGNYIPAVGKSPSRGSDNPQRRVKVLAEVPIAFQRWVKVLAEAPIAPNGE